LSGSSGPSVVISAAVVSSVAGDVSPGAFAGVPLSPPQAAADSNTAISRKAAVICLIFIFLPSFKHFV
jgi:hypothetical protein